MDNEQLNNMKLKNQQHFTNLPIKFYIFACPLFSFAEQKKLEKRQKLPIFRLGKRQNFT